MWRIHGRRYLIIFLARGLCFASQVSPPFELLDDDDPRLRAPSLTASLRAYPVVRTLCAYPVSSSNNDFGLVSWTEARWQHVRRAPSFMSGRQRVRQQVKCPGVPAGLPALPVLRANLLAAAAATSDTFARDCIVAALPMVPGACVPFSVMSRS